LRDKSLWCDSKKLKHDQFAFTYLVTNLHLD
jgi:hypothetical protein